MSVQSRRSNHPGEIAVSIEIHRPGDFVALVRVEDKLRLKLTADMVTHLESVTGSATGRLSCSAWPAPSRDGEEAREALEASGVLPLRAEPHPGEDPQQSGR